MAARAKTTANGNGKPAEPEAVPLNGVLIARIDTPEGDYKGVQLQLVGDARRTEIRQLLEDALAALRQPASPAA